ncbi:MAG: beta-lactamase family protein, partial [Acidobacteria bacterium]|nr:beta-lactamase family protein [Acidobacteriota bacterium]
MSDYKTPTSTAEEELAALRSENEALRDQLDKRQTRGPLGRRILAGVLAVLAIIAVVAAVQAVWLKTTLQDEDRFVATLQSLPQDPAVANVLSIRVANGVVEAAGVEVFVADALPDEMSFLASPLTTAIEDLIARVANEVIQSDAVTSVWTATLRVTHKAVSAVLTGNDGALAAGEGKVAIDLDQVGAVVLERAYGWSDLYDYGTGQYAAWAGGVTEAVGIERRPDPVRMTPATLFDLASVTKVMATTLAVMLMVESGDMHVNAPLCRYLPDFRGGGKDSVTLRHLLTHRAGLYQWLPTYYHATNRDEASEYVRAQPLAWEAGEGRHYSDL